MGLSWGQVGDGAKWGFQNVVHPVGKTLASAFGAGAAAQSLEDVERRQGWLPPQPTATPAASVTPRQVAPSAQPTRAAPAAASLATSSAATHGAFAWIKANPVRAGAYTALGLGSLLLVRRLFRSRGDR